MLIAGPSQATEDNAAILQIDVTETDSGRTKIELWSLRELFALPAEQLRTTTPWTDGVQAFSGVPLGVLLNKIGVTSGAVKLSAANDYSVSTTVAELREAGALLAYRRNNATMRPRDKGPLWVVFAYDAMPRLRRESIYALSVWQLDQISVSR